ncbi:MAG TPA: hypothetical protein VIG94_03760 [Faecalibacter sp.]|uniref:hypothetical protein n=1 Tax=Faecalibacter sp. LW9 TaxID=3103144 RepID=UPI002AFFE7C3|nr:hypothetical protein [Faecalibacter sp. LW9]
MILSQEQLDQATVKIESHIKDIGIQNQFTLKNIEELENESTVRVFIYQIANPTFTTLLQIYYDFAKESLVDTSSPTFSWMDYKKITE